ncbi:MAG TPA: lysophospholipid acyltransferase family protein [Labilithrix sp.]|nr:lysophospholipid acyltransferase family protein [Labilithrix sp.]
MKLTRQAASRARQAYRASGFVATTAAMLPLFLSHHRRVSDSDKDLVRDLWVRRWARALLALFSIDVVVEGSVPPPTRRGERGRLIVANHRSAIDIGVILSTLGGTMVSRDDVATWPVIGAAARSVGTVFVDRGNAKSRMATIRTIEKHLQAGQTIAIFPEGTTYAGDEVRPFFSGAFIAALRAGAEVLPVGLAYPAASGAAYFDETFLAHLGRVAQSTGTRMALAVGRPILPTKDMRATQLTELARAEVMRLVVEARRRAGP